MKPENSRQSVPRWQAYLRMLRRSGVVLILLLVLAACGSQTAQPVIEEFTATAQDVHDQWLLSWNVTGGEQVFLDESPVPAHASTVVTVTEPTTYTLRIGLQTKEVTLAPYPELAITELTTSFAQPTAEAGQELEISWSVQGADVVSIVEIVTGGQARAAVEYGPQTGTATLRFPLDKREANFRLTASNPFGIEESQLLFADNVELLGWVCQDPEDVIEFADEYIETVVRRDIYGMFIEEADEILCGHVQPGEDFFTPLPNEYGQELHHAIIANRCDQDPAEADPLIESLEGIQHLIHLRRLELECNNLTDLSRLASLNMLEELNLDRNGISDLSPLAGLTNLRVLGLYDNEVSDLAALSGMSSLEIAYLSENRISDVSPMAELANLRHVWLYLNCQEVEYDSNGDVTARSDCLADISDLGDLQALESLVFHMNDITDISVLEANLPNLEIVFATGNLIRDVSPLAELPALRNAYLDSNYIQSIEPLVLNTDFPAETEPWTFTRGTVNMPPPGWAPYHLALGENCLDLADAEFQEHLDTLTDRGVRIVGTTFQRASCPTALTTAGVKSARDSQDLLDAFNAFRRAR